MSWAVPALCATAVLLVSVNAEAQCARGRLQTEATAGRCCWPGQVWDEEDNRCSGPPDCPAGFGGEGDSCIEEAADSPPLEEAREAGQEPRGADAEVDDPAEELEWPSSEGPPPGRLRLNPRLVDQPNWTVLDTGSVVALTGYAMSAFWTSLYAVGTCEIGWGPCAVDPLALGWLPVLGPFIHAGVVWSDGAGSTRISGVINLVTGGIQLAGLVLLLIGLSTGGGTRWAYDTEIAELDCTPTGVRLRF